MTLDNNKAHELFNAARNLPSAEREPFLDKECAENDSLRGEVEALLEYHFTSAQTVQSSEQSSDITLDYLRGDTIGSFKILNVLGEGGMGIVYLAEQSKPVRRRVALKVIKAGMDTKQVVARFEAERQALAIMNHPGIAQVFEAGVTEHGRPYFVMEHVKGMPITDACDELKLTTKQRLELMAKVCDAVQHAHSKMIIHRDLKPNNILVSIDDKKLEPKIIDFGVAKAMTYQLTEMTLVTQVGHFVGTPAYMSPEQADLKALDIDAKTDVYALGVVLYEVLTGMPPFDPQTLRDAGLEKMREIIRTQPPPKPSTQLSSLDAGDATEIAQARQTQIAALAGLLRKELEWIPLKALKKLRTERYDSAKSMSDDIRRYLAGEALEAGPDSASYRFKKTLRKHTAAAVAISSIFVILIAAVIGISIFAVEAAVERADAVRAKNESRMQAYRNLIILARRDDEQGNKSSSVSRLAEAKELIKEQYPINLPFEFAYATAQSTEAFQVLDDLTNTLSGQRIWISTAFNPAGTKYAAVAMIDKDQGAELHIWDTNTWEHDRTIALDSTIGVTDSIAFSQDNKSIAISGFSLKQGSFLSFRHSIFVSHNDGQFYELPRSRDSPKTQLPGFCTTVLQFTHDGNRLRAWCPDGILKVWILENGRFAHKENIDTIVGEGENSHRASDSNGTTLASSSSTGTINIWNIDDSDEISKPITLETDEIEHPNEISAYKIALSADGTRIASGGLPLFQQMMGENIDLPATLSNKQSVHIWDTTTGHLITTIHGVTGSGMQVALNFDGTQLGARNQKGVEVWDIENKSKVTMLTGYTPMFLSYAPMSNLLAVASSNNDINLFDTDINKIEEKINTNGTVLSTAFSSPDGRLLAMGVGSTVQLWDMMAGEILSTIQLFDGPLPKRAGGAEVKTLLEDAFDNARRRVSNIPRCIVFSDDGTLMAACTTRGDIFIWDIATGEKITHLFVGSGEQTEYSDANYETISLHPNGSKIAIGSYTGGNVALSNKGAVEVWDIHTGLKEKEFKLEKGVQDVAFSPNGDLLAISTGCRAGDSPALLWEENSQPYVFDRSLWSNYLGSDGAAVAFFRDGTDRIATTSDNGHINIWSQGGHELLFQIDRQTTTVGNNFIAISTDGNRIISQGRHASSIGIWDTNTGQEVGTLEITPLHVSNLKLSPDGLTLVSSDLMRGTYLWEARSHALISRTRNLARKLILEFSPIVDQWIELSNGSDSQVILMLEREILNRSSMEAQSLRNLVLKKLIELRQAKQTQDSE